MSLWSLTKGTALLCWILICLFLVSFALDRGLMLLGFPAEKNRHPRNYELEIRNPEFVYQLKTNSQGLRYRELPLRKPASQFRMLILGDSFTEGFGVKMNEAYPAALEGLANAEGVDAAFINAGISTFSVGDYRRLLLELGLSYEQDGVLIGIYANDLAGADREPRKKWETFHSLLPRIYTALEELYLYVHLHVQLSTGITPASRSLDSVLAAARKDGISNERILSWLQFLREENLVSFNDALLIAPGYYQRALLDPNYFVDAMDIRTESAEAQWVVMTDELKEIVEYCRQNGLWLGLVYLPSYMQYDKDAVSFWQRAGINIPDKWLTEKTEKEKRLLAWSETHKIPFVSLTGVFQRAPREFPYKYNWPADGHWNAAGHKLAALSIYEWLSEVGIIPTANES